MEVFLIRHTTPQVDKGICYGQTDLDIAESYQKEKAVVIQQLPHQVDKVYSSPLKRCYILAKDCYPTTRIIKEHRLKELDFGDWEMKTWNSIPEEEITPWMKDFVHLGPPKGESMKDLNDRVIHWLSEVRSSNMNTICAFTHSGVIRAILSHINNTPLQLAFEKYTILYGQVIKITL